MLETLLESKAKSEGSVAGAIVSVTAHTALIAAALYATAQARVQPAEFPETVRPIYFPSPQISVSNAPRTTTRQPPSNSARLAFVAPRLDLHVPTVDITDLATTPGDFRPNSITGAGSSSGGETTAGLASAPFSVDQVERQAALAPGNAPPKYPEMLRSSGVEGQVTAVFIVDEKGRAEEASIRFVHSDNQLFQDAVRVALGRMRFVPAEVGGRKVRQLVQMPFVFKLAR
jgi:periplasmic protein TonB